MLADSRDKHLKTTELQLLDNTLDALDRLFDRDLHVIDLWALLFATAEALRTSVHYDELSRPATDLLAIARSGTSDEIMRQRALYSTDKLRHYLADLLK